MASSGNFPTMNPFIQSGGSGDDKSSGYISNGSLKVNVIKGRCGPVATIGMRTSGKYYFEVYVNYYFGGTNVAIVNESWNLDAMPGYQIDAQNTSDYDLCGYYFETGKLNNAQSAGDGNNFTNYGSGLTNGSVLGVAVDVDNGKIWFHKDGTYPNSGNPATGANPARGAGGTITTAMDFSKTWYVTAGGWGQTTGIITYNFGQDSTFGGEISAGGNQDSNSQGDFKYSVPSGFTCLSSNNIPISADIDPAQTDDNYPSKQFGVVTYNASGGDSYTGLGFKPDLVWVKWRGGDQSNGLFDSSRGTSKVLNSDNTNAEATSSGLTSFDSDGYTMGQYYNQNGREYVGWCWKANGGTTVTNTDGSTDSTVQANTKAGFSIIETPNYSSNSTFGHGLSSAPEFLVARLTGGSRWAVYHKSLSSSGHYVSLNTNDGEATGSFFNSTAPTSSVFSLGASFGGSGAGICYAWHNVEGFQKFGSFVGNGNADGPFIYTGFRPRLIFIKNAGSTGNWEVRDTARDTFNPLDTTLLWDSSTSEASHSVYNLDVLSNGFKIRTTSANYNSSGVSYIYGAWGDVPFKYNNTF